MHYIYIYMPKEHDTYNPYCRLTTLIAFEMAWYIYKIMKTSALYCIALCVICIPYPWITSHLCTHVGRFGQCCVHLWGVYWLGQVDFLMCLFLIGYKEAHYIFTRNWWLCHGLTLSLDLIMNTSRSTIKARHPCLPHHYRSLVGLTLATAHGMAPRIHYLVQGWIHYSLKKLIYKVLYIIA